MASFRAYFFELVIIILPIEALKKFLLFFKKVVNFKW